MEEKITYSSNPPKPVQKETAEFRGIGVTHYGPSASLAAEDVVDYFKSQGFGAEFITRAYLPIEASWTIATTTYPFLSAEVQRVIAIYTSYAICINDTANVSTDDLKGFLARLCGGKPQPNPLLQHKLRFIGEEIRKFYGTFASDMIWKSIIEFACTCVVENEHHGKIIVS
ncbi:hypothetical protein COH20_008052 [Aspergillus flavus]|nr:uncharacterized protein G4B84_010030 [Aspergillus flavus NRRL3357]KAF7622049.1 hypothetical protein AFLA_008597 [Aspergillus flavus NRRL3357]QMW34564.1 hypothetical protein G4B84_010030 [Aspergillus flavus NRRL3357]RAQ68180.1 hypothetical protein COH20_008052 [Aspergillus flavus]RAQ78802.1 hypothetical protein COH21_011372 [Aspergillus flavus]